MEEKLVSNEMTVKDLNENYVKDSPIKVEKIEIDGDGPPRKSTQRIFSSTGNGEQPATSGAGNRADMYSRRSPPGPGGPKPLTDISVGLPTPRPSPVLTYPSDETTGADKNSRRSPGPAGLAGHWLWAGPPKGRKDLTMAEMYQILLGVGAKEIFSKFYGNVGFI